ncbi:MAG: CAP domain-containing protein [Burkholderiaceae bacterium]
MKPITASIANNANNASFAVLSISLLLTLAACGGDASIAQDDNSTGGQNSNANPGDNSANLTSFQTDILDRVNAVRLQGTACGGNTMPAVPSVQWNTLTEAAAQAHSQFMKDSNNLSHTGQNGSSVGDRLTAAGYTWSAVGENIAAGYPTGAAVVQGWIDSVDHCRNLMSSNFRHLGVAVVQGAATNNYGQYWTMVLASMR